SAVGRGSTFTLYLPLSYQSPSPSQALTSNSGRGHPELSPARPVFTTQPTRVAEYAAAARAAAGINVLASETPTPAPAPVPVDYDREVIQPGDRVVLIIEDDSNFARTVLSMAREGGFKGLVALDGETGIAMARDYKPDAITLDINLPDVDGWSVL